MVWLQGIYWVLLILGNCVCSLCIFKLKHLSSIWWGDDHEAAGTRLPSHYINRLKKVIECPAKSNNSFFLHCPLILSENVYFGRLFTLSSNMDCIWVTCYSNFNPYHHIIINPASYAVDIFFIPLLIVFLSAV